MSTDNFSVIIPAHNEANVISRCLNAVYSGKPSGDYPEVIVVANGCSDDTAQVARNAAPLATILELKRSSKTSAMNAGRERASYFPQVFLDADVECSLAALGALCEALREEKGHAASLPAQFDLSRASWPVRAYYRVWIRQPYAKRVLGGSGCFAISKEALEEIGPFPEVIADDFWALSRVADDQRMLVTKDSNGNSVVSYVTPPSSMLEQIQVEARRRLGSDQIRQEFPNQQLVQASGSSLVKSAFANGSSPWDATAFLGMKFASLLLSRWRKLRGNEHSWVRDESSRQR